MTKILDIIDTNFNDKLTIVEITSELFSLVVYKNYINSNKNIIIFTQYLF